MKFKYFNIEKIKEDYLEQIEQFTVDFMFLFPFYDVNLLLANGKTIRIITSVTIYTSDDGKYIFDDLSVEDLEKIIERIFEPALLQYVIRKRGTLN